MDLKSGYTICFDTAFIFSQFTERYMILDWAEAEKLSHIGTIEVTNTYPNMIGDQSCFLCSFKDHQYWQWTYPKIVRYFPEREEMTSMKMFFSNQNQIAGKNKNKNKKNLTEF